MHILQETTTTHNESKREKNLHDMVLPYTPPPLHHCNHDSPQNLHDLVVGGKEKQG